jgi:hypothetical protein
MMAVTVFGVYPADAQSAATAAAEGLLQSIVVRIHIRTPLGQGLCHGFVAEVRGDVAYIVTAKHCVENLSPDAVVTGGRDPNLAITIAYANEGTGIYRRLFWHTGRDDLVIAASFDRPPTSYTVLCSSCISYQTLAPTSQPIPVLSMLSSAGGLPVLSTGMVLVTNSGEWIVLLPTAPGTSGAPVVDLLGNLVGVVSSATVVRGTQAGVMVELVPGALATDLVHYAIGQIESASASLPQPPPPPPPPSPSPSPPRSPVPASQPPASGPSAWAGIYTGVVRTNEPARGDSELTVVIDGTGFPLSLSSATPCPVRPGDHVVLHYLADDDVVVFVSPRMTCTMTRLWT